MKRKALFIVNPISGGKNKDDVPHLIKRHLNTDVFDYVIVFTNNVSHARQLAKDAIGVYDIAVAVGGDGTVNEVASGLVGSNVILGILPFGSGNGLSRFLNIPMDIQKAIENLNTGHIELIDSAEMNGQPFFNMAGMGFDAHISEVFSHNKKRGFLSYIKAAINEIAVYKSQRYHIIIDGKEYDREAFILSLANSSQYGNDMHISPRASVQDGLLDVCVIKPFPAYRLPEMGFRMMFKKVEGSKYLEIIKGAHIAINRQSPGPIHLDGEPQITDAEVKINIVPGSLKVIVGDDYKTVSNGKEK